MNIEVGEIGTMPNVLQAEEYPNIRRLGVRILTEPCACVLVEELKKAMKPRQYAWFSDLFGIQTNPMIDQGPALYAWDVEDVLERMSTGRRQGSQLLWD
jgi:hypothetical protein